MNKFELYRKSFETLRVISQAHDVVIVTATQPRLRYMCSVALIAADVIDTIVIDYADKLGD